MIKISKNLRGFIRRATGRERLYEDHKSYEKPIPFIKNFKIQKLEIQRTESSSEGFPMRMASIQRLTTDMNTVDCNHASTIKRFTCVDLKVID